MKVILTAFSGKMRSDVMEWPEGVGCRIRLPMDLDIMKADVSTGDVLLKKVGVTRKIGVFERTGYNFPVGDEYTREYAAEYRLVNI